MDIYLNDSASVSLIVKWNNNTYLARWLWGLNEMKHAKHLALASFSFHPPHLLFPLLLFSHSFASDSVTPWTACSIPGFPVLHSLPEFAQFMSTESVMLSNHLILCCTLLLLPSVFPSMRVFANNSALCIRWPKYWCFRFSISHSNAYPGLISFRIDWLRLLAV